MNITDPRVLTMPSLTTVRNSGMSIATGGTDISGIIRLNSASRPLNFILAKAYPAKRPTIIVSATAPRERIRLLANHSRKSFPAKAST